MIDTHDHFGGQEPEEIMDEASHSLPPESECTGPEGCRVRVRFPDGQMRTRAFLKEAPLSQLRAFVLASSYDAAAGKAFDLFPAGPGKLQTAISPVR